MKYKKNFYQIKSNDLIFEAIKSDTSEIGYYSLPMQECDDIITFSQTVKYEI